ncbi:MAG: hypothetical protein Q8P35_01450 [Candidatus Yanofskybacteria bacterium]|nr:hypothetical protein [Candidatus Yanofskybacteria bacterium]
MNNSSFSPSSSHSTKLSWQIIAILGVLGFLYLVSPTPGEATLVFDLGNQSRTFKGDVVQNMTVLDALNAASIAGNITFQFVVDENNGIRVIALDQYTFSAGADGLIIFKNDERLELSRLNQIIIRPNDRITVRVVN